MTPSVLGIIGGSGVYDIEMGGARWETVTSPWGEPSDQVRVGEIGGLTVAFLPRHGRGHVYSPTTINYRANSDVMKRLRGKKGSQVSIAVERPGPPGKGWSDAKTMALVREWIKIDTRSGEYIERVNK